ncbi:MAG: T9SS type A sorting domain-containing protein [Hymenobacteraceae bacterium]|nr:T9SS type A sorting domain-containing protein [Hymenobacteraceae bacterium]
MTSRLLPALVGGLLLLGGLVPLSARGQANLKRLEYYYDVDPGYGQGTMVTFPTAQAAQDYTFTAAMTGLTPGYHTLYTRVQDAGKRWSIAQVRPVYVGAVNGTGALDNLTRLEYYFDTDPGYGLGRQVTFPTAAPSIDHSYIADLSGLPPGFHTMYTRVRSAVGAWSIANVRPIYVGPANGVGSTPPNLTLAEYYIDIDPGYGLATRVNLPTPGPSVEHTFVADLSAVSNGIHTLFVRVRTAAGAWSLTQVRPFLRSGATAVTAAPNLTRAEYYLDTDPGYGLGTPIPITPGTSIVQSHVVDLSAVSNGLHTLYVRVQDASKAWSLTTVRPFVRQGVSGGATRPDVVAFRYQIFPANSNVAATAPQVYVIPVAQRGADVDVAWTPDLCLTAAGNYIIRVSALDAAGNSAIEYRHPFNITAPTLFQPNLPAVARGCAGQPITLTSALVGAGGSYLWSTGATTQSISVTAAGSYSVAVTSAAGCVGDDTTQVIFDNGPTVTLPDTVQAVCGQANVTLDAGAGYASYLWSPGGQTTRTRLVTAPGTYSVTVTGASTGSCTASASTVVVMPRADIQQPDQIVCNGASVTLSVAAPTNGAVSWSTGETTPSISVTPATTTTYTATVRVGSRSCADAVILSVPPALADALPDTTRAACGQASVTLDAGAGATSYLWSPGGQTTRTISVNSPGAYSVVRSNGCAWPDQTYVLLPRADIAQADQTICEGQSITLNVTAPLNGTVRWMPGGATTPSISVSPTATTTYTATVRDGGSVCTDNVTISVTPLPTVTLSVFPDVCVSASSFTLTGGAPAGGTYSGPGVSGGQFSPGAAGVGSHAITYTYGSGCTSSATQTLTVRALPTVTLTPFSAVCADGAAVALTGGAPSGGTYSGAGVTAGQFDPAVADVGSHPITYAYTDANGCASAAQQSLTVLPIPTLTVTDSVLCAAQSATIAVLSAGSGATYAWAPGGQTTSSISVVPPDTTLYTVTVTNAAGCQYVRRQTLYPSPFSAPPVAVTNMEPVHNSAGLSLPINFTWAPGARTTAYDLYVWPAADPQPAVPTVAGVQAIQYAFSGPLTYGDLYKWRVVSVSPCGSTAGPVQEFRLRELPDVRVSYIANPDTAYAGQTLQVTWNITNLGTGSTLAQGWSDAVWASADSVFNPTTAILLGTRGNTTFLQPNATYITDATFNVPLSMASYYHIFVETDYYGNLLESNDGNNRRRAQLNRTLVIVPTTPDLRVMSFAAPTIVIGGDSATITYRVRNIGQVAATAPWTDGLYISPDTVQNIAQNTGQGTLGPNARRGGGRLISQTLMPGDQYQNTVKLVIPHTMHGSDFYLYAYADDQNNIFETASTNNVNARPWTKTQVVLRPTPDLVIRPFSVPTAVTAGTPLALSWTGANDGANPPYYPVETYFGDAAWLSLTPTFDENTAIRLGTVYQYNAHQIQAGQTWTGAGAFGVPNGISGTYWVFVKVDAGNQVFEFPSETNNLRRSNNQVTVNLVYADLTPTALTAPATVAAHASFLVNWTVRNTNTALIPAGGAWNDATYANGYHLATVRHAGPLAVGASYSASATVSLPIQIGAGPFTLTVVTDAGGEVYENLYEGNNTRTTTTTLLYADDLLVQSLAAPGTATAGLPLTATWQVRNAGPDRTLTSGWADELYLSANNALDGADLRVARLGNVGGQLASGGQYNQGATFTLPQGLSGTYYLIARTAIDPNGALNDQNPANNQQAISKVVVLPPPADLVVFGTPTLPATAIAGQQIQIGYTVRNTGSGPTPASSWNDGIYLNTSPTMSGGATRIGNVARTGALAAGVQYAVSTLVTVPGYLAGNYYLFIVADNSLPSSYAPTVTYWGGAVQYGDVYEHTRPREINNPGQTLSLTITAPQPADLVVTAVSVPATGMLGRHMAVQYTVQNQGANAAVGLLKDAVFLSENRILDGAVDRIFASSTQNLTLGPGQSLPLTLRGRVEAVNPGLYHGIGATNLYDDIYETTRLNDTLSTASQVNIGINVLPMLTPTSFPLDLDSLVYYKVTPGANKDLLLALTSDHALGQNEVYVAYNRVPTPADFDFIYEDPINTQQELLIPSTGPGAYYILVKTPYVYPGLQTATLYAEALPFSVRSITRNVVGQGRVTTTVRGAGFNAQTRFFLTRGTDPAIVSEARVVRFRSSVHVVLRWTLNTVDLGLYHVVAQNPGAPAVRVQLIDGLTVEPSRGLDVNFATIIPASIRAGRSGDWTYFLKNTSNVDIPYWDFSFNVPANSRPVITHTPNARKKSDFHPGGTSGTVLNLLPDGPTEVVPMVAHDVVPDDVVQVNLRLTPPMGPGPGDPPMPYPVVWNQQALTPEWQTARTLAHVGRYRAAVLANPTAFAAGVVNLAANSTAWTDSMTRYYARLNLLDTAWVGQNPRTGYTQPMSAAVLPGGICNSVFQITECARDFRPDPFTSGYAPALIGCADSLRLLTNSRGASCTTILASCDPNVIAGPDGYGAKKWVGTAQALPYQIQFENDPLLASAPAQVVRVTQPLAPAVDERTFRLGDFGFGPYRFSPPANASTYSRLLNLPDSLGYDARVTAGVDVVNRQAFWVLETIDPETGLAPTDALAGLLPINDSTGAGEGFVNYVIQANPLTGVTGDSITAQARIVFDGNPAIMTNRWWNILDAVAPTSQVAALPALLSGTTAIPLTWTGADDANASGLHTYDLYVSQDGGPFAVFAAGLTRTDTTFVGLPGSRYDFFTLARDFAGNQEALKLTGDAFTTLEDTAIVVYDLVHNQCLTTDTLVSTGTGTWLRLKRNGRVVAALNDRGLALGKVAVSFTVMQGGPVRSNGAGREYLDRNWHVWTQNAFAGNTVDIRFYALKTEFDTYKLANDGDGNDVQTPADLKLTKYSGPNEDCLLSNNQWNAPTAETLLLTPAVTVPTAAPYFVVQATIADHFSEFFLNGGDAPLPLELVRFDAKRAGHDVRVTWRTASEQNAAEFVVEAGDGPAAGFTEVGRLAAHGTTNVVNDYALTDHTVPATGGLRYYRLRQVDADGRVTYSDVRAVRLDRQPLTVQALPNPVGAGAPLMVRLTTPADAATATVRLVDLAGRLLLTRAVPLAAGQATLALPEVGQLPPGVYVLTVTAGAESRAVRVVKE